MSTFSIVIAMMAVMAPPGAWAQPLEFEPGDPSAPDERSLDHSVQGQVYTYADGDRTLRVLLQPDLEVSESGTRSNGEHIVPKGSSGKGTGQPVFRSGASGTLMTLPGGVVLVLDAAWSPAQTNAFFARNRIARDRVSAMNIAANSFFVETEPGFPSLELANTLAAQNGVRIASPNWWREHTLQSATAPRPCAM